MPIYEYRCPTCGRGIEVLQKINDPAPLCPTCKWNPYKSGDEETMVKIVSRVSKAQFKGPGFYETDYKDK